MEYPQESNFVPEALIPLRVQIDVIDHQILDLLSQRNSVVEQVAKVKRTSNIAIRDYTRERELLKDRVSRAHDVGLRSEVIESLFRVILWASRDHQASLGAAFPVDPVTKVVAIIGGNGGMGQLMVRLFRDFGHTVIISDQEQSNAEAASKADVVVVAVPIACTLQVIEEIAPHCKKDALLMDVTSTKTNPLKSMMHHFQGSVIGTHPLFGPSVHSLQGQRIAVICGRDKGEWLSWLCKLFQTRGLSILKTTAKEHDQAMGIVQVLTHQTTEVLGRTIQKLGVDIQKTLAFTSPIYLIELLMTARHFAQSAELYASIQMNNPETDRVLNALQMAGEELRAIVQTKDSDGFEKLFNEVHRHFGAFSEQALEQSSFLIDRLVERG